MGNAPSAQTVFKSFKQAFDKLFGNKEMRVVMLGYLPVDGFMLLTGFLIAYPLVTAESRGRPLLPAGGVSETEAISGLCTRD